MDMKNMKKKYPRKRSAARRNIAVVLSLAMVFSLVSGVCGPVKKAKAAVESSLPSLNGLYCTEYMNWDENGMCLTDTDENDNVVPVDWDGNCIPYMDQDNPEYLTNGIEEEWGFSFENNQEKWFDYIEDGKVTHVKPSELIVTHLDGTPCEDVTITEQENDPRVAVFQTTALEKVKITYAGAEVNNAIILQFDLHSGFYTSETLSLDSLITDTVDVIRGKSKDLYFHMTDSWEEAGFRYDPDTFVNISYWDREKEEEVELTGEEAEEYVTFTPVSDTDPHHLIFKITILGKEVSDDWLNINLRYTEYNQEEESDEWETDNWAFIHYTESNVLYTAYEWDLRVKDGKYTYANNANYGSATYRIGISTYSPIYMMFKYSDENGEFVTVNDPSKLTFYRSEYDEEQGKQVFTPADESEIKAEKAYDDSDLIKISYTGDEFEFQAEYVVTYDGKKPDPEDNITVNFTHAILNEVSIYSSEDVSDATYASEFHTDGQEDLDIYAACFDVSDIIFWNKIQSVSLRSFTLRDENGEDLSDQVMTSDEVTITEETGHSTIYGEKITIPKGTLNSSAVLTMNFNIVSIGGDEQEHDYDTSFKVFIFYSEPSETPTPSIAPEEESSTAPGEEPSIAPGEESSTAPDDKPSTAPSEESSTTPGDTSSTAPDTTPGVTPDTPSSKDSGVSLAQAQISGIDSSYVYTGQEQKPVPVVQVSGKTLVADQDYTVSYTNNKNVGTAQIVIQGIGSYTDPITVTFEITKATNPMTLKVSKKIYKRKKDLKKKKSFKIGVEDEQGTVTYKLTKKAKKAKIKVSKKGKVVVPKKCKKGSFTITVQAKGNENYLSGKKKVKIKVK